MKFDTNVNSRRRFLRAVLSAAPSLLALFPELSQSVRAGLVPLTQAARFPGVSRAGRLLSVVPFEGEGKVAVSQRVGTGLRARLALDLSLLTPQSLITPNDQFFIRTGFPDLLDLRRPWKMAVDGLVEQPFEVALSELSPDVADQGVFLAECSGNSAFRSFGLISAARFAGVSLSELIGKWPVLPSATYLLIEGFDRHSGPAGGSQPGASWVFRVQDVKDSGAFLATQMNGEQLPRDHGFPLRLVVPGWYGCTWIKWVNRLIFLDDLAEATGQMKEFAGRTHQRGIPEKAADYLPAVIDLAAMPVRVEKREGNEGIYYRVAGIFWGGGGAQPALLIRFSPEEKFEKVNTGIRQFTATWGFWSHDWKPERPGRYPIELKAANPEIRTRRLDGGYYRRTFRVE